jgi:hypothetical protein
MRESVEADLRKTRAKRDDHEATIAGVFVNKSQLFVFNLFCFRASAKASRAPADD